MATRKGKKSGKTIRDIPAKAVAEKQANGVKGGCASGAHYKTVTLAMRKAGADSR